MIKLGVSLSHLNINIYNNIFDRLLKSSIEIVEIYYTGSEDVNLFLKKTKDFSLKLFSIHCRKDLFFQLEKYVVEYLDKLMFLRENLPHTYFLFHPNGNIQLYLLYLQKLHMVVIENTLPNEDYLLDLVYTNDFQMVYDVAHANYFGGQYKLIADERLAYVHLKGYCQNNSCLLKNSDLNHLTILKGLQNDIPYILEYSYHSINEIYQDVFYVKRYLKG